MYTFKHTENNIEECYYDSTNVLYTKLIDTPNELKTLTVVFKQGGTYVYEDVDVREYVRFRDSESTGKAFASIIAVKDNGKPRYRFHRIEDTPIEQLLERKRLLEESSIVASDNNTDDTSIKTDAPIDELTIVIDDESVDVVVPGKEKNITFSNNNTLQLMDLLRALKISYRTTYK